MSDDPIAARPRSTIQLPALDGLRCMVVFVLFIHFADSAFFDGRPLEGLPAIGYMSTRYAGFLALEMFFVLSGFLITGILLDTKGSATYFQSFYARRFLRVFPLYYGVLTLYFLVVPAVAPRYFSDLKLTAGQQLPFWTYMTNFAMAKGSDIEPSMGHLWSLAVEEQFYLAWPLVVYLCSASQLKKMCVLLLMVTLTIRWGLIALGADFILFYTATFSHMDGLAVGSLMSVLWREEGSLATIARRVHATSLGALIAIAIAIATGAQFTQFDRSIQAGLWLTAAVPLGASMVVASLTQGPTGQWRRFLENSIVRRIGTYSYGTYVLHLPLTHFLDVSGLLPRPHPEAGMARELLYAAIAIPAMILAGGLSWHFFEEKILRFKRFFPYRYRAN